MRHTEVTNAPLFFPFLHCLHNRTRIHQAMALHEIDPVAPEPFHRAPQLTLCMAVVAKPFTRGPDPVGNEQLIGDAQGRRKIAGAQFSHAVERGSVDDAVAAIGKKSTCLNRVSNRFLAPPIRLI